QRFSFCCGARFRARRCTPSPSPGIRVSRFSRADGRSLNTMQRLLCTIGFTGKTAEEFFALLRGAGIQQLIDVRQNRGGQLSGFAKHPDLSFFLRAVEEIEYAHEPLLAPPPELLKSYRKGRDWPAYEAAFLEEMKKRGVPGNVNTASWAA